MNTRDTARDDRARLARKLQELRRAAGLGVSASSCEIGPLDAPLTYPGPIPNESAILVTHDALARIEPGPQPVGCWLVEGCGKDLDVVLGNLNVAPIGDRHAVIAIGSNASPPQLRQKFRGTLLVIPMTRARVGGIIAGLSAHVSRPGYIAATPVTQDGTVSDLYVTWLDNAELRILDKTEPNYRRVRVPARYLATLPCGQVLDSAWIYVSRHGYLVNSSGSPRQLLGQAELIASLLADVPDLAELAGSSPEEWLQRTRDEAVRDRIRELFRSAGIVRALTLG